MRSSILGFAITVGALVPAGWHLVSADLEVDGKHLRPLQKSLALGDGVTVTLDVDRAVVMTGDAVTATLVATGPARQVAVDVRTLHATNYAGERVERPWSAIDRETIHLTAAPGGGPPVVTRLVLGKRPQKKALEDSFEILVSSHGAEVPKRDFDAGGDARDFDAMIERKTAAGVFVRGWSGDSLGLAVAARTPVSATKPFTIAVTVTNTTGRTLETPPWVTLSTEAALTAQDGDAGDAAATPAADTPALAIESEREREHADGDSTPETLAPGKSIERRFTITPHGALPATITFLAAATENEGLGPYGAGALDAITFAVPRPAAVASE